MGSPDLWSSAESFTSWPQTQFVSAQCQRYAEETDRPPTLLLLLGEGGTSGWHHRFGSRAASALSEFSPRTTPGERYLEALSWRASSVSGDVCASTSDSRTL